MKKNKDFSYIISYDKVVFFTYILLCLTGVIVMLDITSMQSSMVNFYRHLVFLVVSALAAILVLYFFNLEKLRPLNRFFVYLVIALLLIVLIKGDTVKGATRQINLGLISIQPSFLARVALIFFFASYLDKKHDELISANLKEFCIEFMPLIVFSAVTFILIVLGRHLSTLIIGAATLLGMLIYAGAKKRIIALIVLFGMVSGWIIITQGASYRSSRLQTYKIYSLLLKDRPAPTNSAEEYQVRESLTALTSGRLFGTGMGRGRAKHYYLPEPRTDYIFTIIGEEFGFLGAIFVFGLHILLFFRSFRIAEAQEDKYLKFLCAGLAMNIFFNALVNTGVAMSILPSTGNTLPFISYGGTALLVDSASVGVILNISAKRRQL